MMTSRIALGTVQFGLQYGISNAVGIPGDDELRSIFGLARDGGIQVLDTAAAYGNSEERIGKLAADDFQVVTKAFQVRSPENLEQALTRSLERLDTRSVYGLMFHTASELIDQPRLWDPITRLKGDGHVLKVGYSLYDVSQLDVLLNEGMTPDIVQVPFNILDRRFEERLDQLKSLGTEIHVRSVFLQGLLLSETARKQAYFKQWAQLWTGMERWHGEANLSPLEACLSHVLSYLQIDKVVLGVTGITELQEILDVVDGLKPLRAPAEVRCDDKELINPSLWQLNQEQY